MESPAVISCMIVSMVVGLVRNVKHDLIWVGFVSGSNVGRFGFFLVFYLLFFLFCGHYGLVKHNGCNGCNSICCSCSY